jgi:hypothetical protein
LIAEPKLACSLPILSRQAKPGIGFRPCSDFDAEAKLQKFYFKQGKFCSRMRAIRQKV